MNIKQLNQRINKWQNIIHDIKQGNRDSFITIVKEGCGDDGYARDCTNAEAIIQCKLAMEELQAEIDFEKGITA